MNPLVIAEFSKNVIYHYNKLNSRIILLYRIHYLGGYNSANESVKMLPFILKRKTI